MKKVDQVSAQYNVVQVLAECIQHIANEMHLTLREDIPEAVLDVMGNRSAGLMEDLGDILNGMDAVNKGNEWMAPVFERAHAMYPQKQNAPRTVPCSEAEWDVCADPACDFKCRLRP